MDASSSTFNIRETSLNIQDVGAFVDLVEIIRVEDEPNLPAEKRLEWRKNAVENDGKTCIGYTIESGDQTVGMVNYTNIGNLPNEGTPIDSIVIVKPEFRKQGYGKQLYESGLERLRELGFDRCFSHVRENNDAGLAFAQHLGFSEVDREYKLTLDITGLTDEEVKSPADSDIQVSSLAQLKATDSRWLEKLHELSIAFVKDLPSRVDISGIFPDNLDAFGKLLFTEWKIHPEGSSVAIVDGVWVATTWITQAIAESDWCYHLMTGVRPEYRRRGLVKLLKRDGFAWCKKAGIRYIHTIQHETNKPMLTLNLNLGFKIMSGYVMLEHQF